jgi:hypothetical protein
MTQNAEQDQAGAAGEAHTEPNAFARELLAHDPALPEVPELPGEAPDEEKAEAHHAAEDTDRGEDEGERFDAG